MTTRGPYNTASKRDPLGLTARERQVAEMLPWSSTPTVAFTLGIAQATVERHRKNIFRKLGIGNRNELRTRLGFHALSQELSEPFSESCPNG